MAMNIRLFLVISLLLLVARASKLTAPDGTVKYGPTWPAAFYTGDAPAGEHDVVFLSDITVPYADSTCDPSTYTQSIKGKVLIDTDGYGGESPLLLTCVKKAPVPLETTLQKFKASGVVAVISINWWLPHSYYVSDLNDGFVANPAPARAVGMPWYVGQNSWRDATSVSYGLRYGWREMFGGGYQDIQYCTPSCTGLAYPGKKGATCITHSSPSYSSCTNVPTVKIEVAVTDTPVIAWAFSGGMVAMYYVSATISILTVIVSCIVLQRSVKTRTLDAICVSLLEGVAGGIFRAWRSFNQPLGFSALGASNVSIQNMRNLDSAFSLASSFIVCFSCFRLLRRQPLTAMQVKIGYLLVLLVSVAVFFTLLVWNLLLITDTTSDKNTLMGRFARVAMATASLTAANGIIFALFVFATLVQLVSVARKAGKRELLVVAVKILVVSLTSVVNSALCFVTYYMYACTNGEGDVGFTCSSLDAPIHIQYADQWVLELPASMAGMAQVFLYYSSSSSSS